MGCDTCIFQNDVRNHAEQKGSKLEPCSMEYGCNPYFKEGANSSILISEPYCGTCNALQKDCQCAEGVRQIRNRKVQVARNRGR